MKSDWYTCIKYNEKTYGWTIACMGPYPTATEADNSTTNIERSLYNSSRLIPVCSYMPAFMKDFIVKKKMLNELMREEKFLISRPLLYKK